jgi:flagellar FliJ protein
VIKRSDRIMKVVALAISEERRECLAFGKAQRALDDEIGRLEELQDYRRGYAERPVAGACVNSVRWQDYQHFLSRLDNAVNAQKQLIADGEKNTDVHRRRWMVKRQRLESLERVIERYRRVESLQDERLLQKALDDLPQRGDLYEEES